MIKFWDIRENGNRQAIKGEKRNKIDFVRFAWNHARDAENAKLAILNKENMVMIYDYRNSTAPTHTINPKPNSSQEICSLSWDQSDSVLFLVGGE